MKVPSVYIAEELMPYLRARVSKILYSKGFTQAQIATWLGTTQAMVSKYLSGGVKAPPREVGRLLDVLAEEIARLVEDGARKEEIILFTTRRLISLFRERDICEHYSRYARVSTELCSQFFATTPEKDVLSELGIALRELLALEGFGGLIPEVRSNFAYALPEAKTPSDVASVPGRITLVKGRPFALPPEFGASKFTAGLLLEVMKRRPAIRSVVNIRYGDDVEKALEKAGFKVVRVRTGGMEEADAVKALAAPFEKEVYDAVIDEGGEGVEPLVYIFGGTPFEVLRKVEKLIEVLRGDES
ncbi:thiamine-phosphate synthase family protein [Thermococcus stetteri]|uniref:thiamine-phosphate synthase family protein n=1 Tax=Thermococcus stetteri TaxID=49900 RepID=UPI001AE11743|nr:thiamine-phosphate synthase family protein [Thermococcus stetteri]MBP1911231.1 putative fused transcriptional regulator/phosphomethylpyrimidine kinase/putative transcriptional regulator [Thermococcus stetteri]